MGCCASSTPRNTFEISHEDALQDLMNLTKAVLHEDRKVGYVGKMSNNRKNGLGIEK